MDPQLTRTLNADETAMLVSLTDKYDLPVVLKQPTEFKILTAKVICARCEYEVIQYIKMAKYNDSLWMRISDAYANECGIYDTELCSIKITFCRNCFAIPEPQQIRAADFYRKLISEQYSYLCLLEKKKSITKRSAIETIIISAQRIAQCYEQPQTWRDYLPKQLRGQLNE